MTAIKDRVNSAGKPEYHVTNESKSMNPSIITKKHMFAIVMRLCVGMLICWYVCVCA